MSVHAVLKLQPSLLPLLFSHHSLAVIHEEEEPDISPEPGK
jgi:hypothetical protein